MDNVLRLGTYDFPNEFRVTRMPQTLSVPTDEIPRRHGVAVGTGKLREKTISIEGMLKADQVRVVRDAVMAQLMGGRQKLYIEEEDRYLYVQLANLDEAEVGPGQLDVMRNYAFDFIADQPIWEAASESSNTWNAPGNGDHVDLVIAGTATCYPTFAITFPNTESVDLAIALGTYTFTFAGAVTAGDVMLINGDAETVTLQATGADKISLFDGWLPAFAPGAIAPTLTLTAGTITSIVITWRNRWY